MKKGYSGSSRKSMGSSSKSHSSSSKPLFSSKPRSSVKTDRASQSGGSMGGLLKKKIKAKKESSFEKPHNDPGAKHDHDGFEKPYNDPGAKYRDEGYQGDGSGTVQSSGGRGCCGGITGMISLFAVLAAVVIIVLIVKCL